MANEPDEPGAEDTTTTLLDDDPVGEVTDVEGTPTATVIVMSGPHVGQMRPVRGDELSIGRTSTSDLHLPDPGVSRSHARLYREGDAVYLEDVGSSNGTYVNGAEIEGAHLLEAGDKITIGSSTVLKFAIQDPVEQSFQQKMYEASLRDDLTDAYNKHFLLEHLRSELSYASRHGTKLSLVLLDLDHFKELNDTFGHVAGDEVLCEVADRLERSVRTEDVFARYGGEEFAIVLRGIDLDGAYVMAERVRRIVSGESYRYDGDEIEVSTSAGVASYEVTEPEDAEELLEAADQALYNAKDAGRNQVWCMDSRERG